MLYDILKNKLTEVRRANLTVEKNVLSVVLGDCDTYKARHGSITDEQVEKIIRKLIENNQDSLTKRADCALEQENAFLKTILPKSLSKEEIRVSLNEIIDSIKEAKSTGMATGIAMKFLKSKDLKASGTDVSSLVEEIRCH